ncbi:MAG: hypothetical protein O3A01_04390, partial [bacterium]|nr:hypothetical protein [bacterium]
MPSPPPVSSGDASSTGSRRSLPTGSVRRLLLPAIAVPSGLSPIPRGFSAGRLDRLTCYQQAPTLGGATPAASVVGSPGVMYLPAQQATPTPQHYLVDGQLCAAYEGKMPITAGGIIGGSIDVTYLAPVRSTLESVARLAAQPPQFAGGDFCGSSGAWYQS